MSYSAECDPYTVFLPGQVSWAYDKFIYKAEAQTQVHCWPTQNSYLTSLQSAALFLPWF
jgi:hypothetical protein